MVGVSLLKSPGHVRRTSRDTVPLHHPKCGGVGGGRQFNMLSPFLVTLSLSIIRNVVGGGRQSISTLYKVGMVGSDGFVFTLPA